VSTCPLLLSLQLGLTLQLSYSLVPRSRKNNRRRRTSKRRRAGGSLASASQLALGGFPRQLWPSFMPLRLKYTDFRTVTASGNVASYGYRQNSVFDPDYTGVGGQPNGFDQFKVIYQYYRVVMVEVRITWMDVTSSARALCVLGATADSSSPSTGELLGQTNFSRSGLVGTQTDTASQFLRVRTSQLAGVDDQSILADDTYKADVGANPGRVFYIWCMADTSGSTDQVSFRIEITYFVRFETRIDVEDTVRRAAVADLWHAPNPQSLEQYFTLHEGRLVDKLYKSVPRVENEVQTVSDRLRVRSCNVPAVPGVLETQRIDLTIAPEVKPVDSVVLEESDIAARVARLQQLYPTVPVSVWLQLLKPT